MFGFAEVHPGLRGLTRGDKVYRGISKPIEFHRGSSSFVEGLPISLLSPTAPKPIVTYRVTRECIPG